MALLSAASAVPRAPLVSTPFRRDRVVKLRGWIRSGWGVKLPRLGMAPTSESVSRQPRHGLPSGAAEALPLAAKVAQEWTGASRQLCLLRSGTALADLAAGECVQTPLRASSIHRMISADLRACVSACVHNRRAGS